MMGAAMRDTAPAPRVSLEVSPDSGTILAVDPRLENLLGFRPGELVGLHVSALAGGEATRPQRVADPFVEPFADATHDLLGPLNQAAALVTLLVRKFRAQVSDADTESLLGFISTSVKRMEALADSLKLYSRVLGSPSVPRQTDLNELSQALPANFQPAIGAGELELECAPLPTVVCDTNQILFLLTQLVENAWKFRRNGRVSCAISCFQRLEEYVFSVRDNGAGFDSRRADQIFRMFKRLEGDRYPGTGAGLAICRQIINRHNGIIWAESVPGSGTTVFFTLPVTR